MLTKYQQPVARKFRAEEGGEGGEGGGEGGGNALEALQAKFDALNGKFEEAETEKTRLSAKLTESNKHTKEAERLRKEAELKQHQDSGNYEELYKASEQGRVDGIDQIQKLTDRMALKDVLDVAGTIALALDPMEGAAGDLKTKIAKRLKSTEEGVKVLDKSGNLTSDTFEKLQSELSGSAEFSYMLKGSKANGGGAKGGDNGSGATETITRAEYDNLSPKDQAAKMKSGVTINRL